MKNERFHTSRTHRRTCIQKSFFYFVHEANAFVVLRFFLSKDDFLFYFSGHFFDISSAFRRLTSGLSGALEILV